MVLDDRGSTFLVAMADPTDLTVYDEISRILRRDIDLAVVTETELLRAVDRSYRRTEEISGLAQELQADFGDSTAIHCHITGCGRFAGRQAVADYVRGRNPSASVRNTHRTPGSSPADPFPD